MKNSLKSPILALVLGGLLVGCRTVAPEPEPVFIPTPEARTCFPRDELIAVVIPEETKTYTAVTMVDNPPGPPIERTEQVTRVVREAYTVFQTAEGAEVSEDMICSEDIISNPSGIPTGS